MQPDDLSALCEAFSQALTRFGYPECLGKIMVNNPAWRGSVQNWRERTRGWLLGGTPENLMNLAIFLDAHAVCGDSTLLDDVRTALWQLATDHAATLSRFAAAIDAFGGGGGGWWNRRDVDPGSKGHPDRFGLPTREELMPVHNKAAPAAPTRFD